eukprot:1137945-Pelagomonas_calceolata.AAC.5
MIVVKGCSLEGCPVIRGRVLLRDEGEGASEERNVEELLPPSPSSPLIAPLCPPCPEAIMDVQ